MRPLLRSTAGGDGLTSPSLSSSSPPPLGEAASEAISVDSDMVVILASLLCALISVVGLALVARCACRWPRAPRSSSSSSSNNLSSSLATTRGGLKKKAIEALPTVSFVQGGGGGGGSSECAICLAQFAEGEELRVLPHCSHAFHVACIDAWLGAHASCPSCRAAIMVPAGRCRRCGAAGDDLTDVEHADGTGALGL